MIFESLVCILLCLSHPPFVIIQDVLRSQDKDNKFFFYEVYGSSADVDFHKTQSHYQAWADFKESGGVISSVSHKADGEFMGE